MYFFSAFLTHCCLIDQGISTTPSLLRFRNDPVTPEPSPTHVPALIRPWIACSAPEVQQNLPDGGGLARETENFNPSTVIFTGSHPPWTSCNFFFPSTSLASCVSRPLVTVTRNRSQVGKSMNYPKENHFRITVADLQAWTTVKQKMFDLEPQVPVVTHNRCSQRLALDPVSWPGSHGPSCRYRCFHVDIFGYNYKTYFDLYIMFNIYIYIIFNI